MRFQGSSVVMYRDENLRRYQYFVTPDWAGEYRRSVVQLLCHESLCPFLGGVYASPSLAGSRCVFYLLLLGTSMTLAVTPSPGALIAGTWAAMQYMGHKWVYSYLYTVPPLHTLLQRIPGVVQVNCYLRQKNRGCY